MIEPEAVAEAVVAGLAKEEFLILPHPQVAAYFQRKASDYDRWLAGMRRLRDRASTTADARARAPKRARPRAQAAHAVVVRTIAR